MGLAPTAVRAYRMLVKLPTASVGELAAGLGMSIMDVRAVLRGLEAKGLVGRLPGTTARFQAAPPEQALEPLVRRRHRELRTMRADVDAIRHEYRTGDVSADAFPSMDLVIGAAALRDHRNRMIAAAASEVCRVCTDPSVSQDPAPSGVRTRVIYPRAAVAGADDAIRATLTAGVEVRAILRPPTAMLLVDGMTALLPVHIGGDGPAALVVWPGRMHDALMALFERTWALASRLVVTGTGEVTADDPVLPPASSDLRLLRLMLEGLTDQAIAGRMGLGERTVQRRVRDLIDLVGVQTRLQLVWQATQRGWI